MGEPEIKPASAGPTGERVRSDLNVAYEPGDRARCGGWRRPSR